jgi:hypothetical protein
VSTSATFGNYKSNQYPNCRVPLPLLRHAAINKKLTKAEWQFLLDKVDRYLATWKARLMSKAGRLQLLNSGAHFSCCVPDDYTRDARLGQKRV